MQIEIVRSFEIESFFSIELSHDSVKQSPIQHSGYTACSDWDPNAINVSQILDAQSQSKQSESSIQFSSANRRIAFN